MSSSSTNKQPMLVDRPLLAVVSVGEAAALVTATNLRTHAPAGLKELANGGDSGCCIDSITAVAPEAGITASRIVVFASRQANAALLNSANCWPIAGAALDSSAINQRTNIPLLPLLAPVPNLASPAATMATYPGELDKKNAGLLLPVGWYLYVGSSVILATGLGPSQAVVVAQGGYY